MRPLRAFFGVGCQRRLKISVGYPYARGHLTGTGDGVLALAAGQIMLRALILFPPVLIFAVIWHGFGGRSMSGGPPACWPWARSARDWPMC
jgi:hypothetical protein